MRDKLQQYRIFRLEHSSHQKARSEPCLQASFAKNAAKIARHDQAATTVILQCCARNVIDMAGLTVGIQGWVAAFIPSSAVDIIDVIPGSL